MVNRSWVVSQPTDAYLELRVSGPVEQGTDPATIAPDQVAVCTNTGEVIARYNRENAPDA